MLFWFLRTELENISLFVSCNLLLSNKHVSLRAAAATNVPEYVVKTGVT